MREDRLRTGLERHGARGQFDRLEGERIHDRWRNSSVRMHRTHRSARVARRRGSGGQLSLVQSLLHLRAHSTPAGFVNVAVIDLFAQLSWR